MDEPESPLRVVHVTTHTHWDREWYRTAAEFRLALVDLVDEVLDGAAGPHFLLDGQAIVLRDYLTMRPDRLRDVRDALGEGRVEAGPWYVLGDNLIVGGESLIRNLLVGRSVLAELGAAPPSVLYCPDSFGHPAALPRLAVGFGATLCVVWRGYGGAPWPPGDSARWRDRDGSQVLLHHLAPDGYELGSNLPVAADQARDMWERLRAVLAPRSTLGIAYLPNGADHHAVQRDRAAAIAALAQAASPVHVVEGGLQALADSLVESAAARSLPLVTGELRRSPDYAWSLQGTFGTRAPQKRRNALAERLLVHRVEPQQALAWWSDRRSRRHKARSIWQTLLSCHPHDTLCGCSVDAVASAMDQRLGDVMRAGTLALERATLERLGDDPAAARDQVEAWRPALVVRNDLPRPRGGIVELEIDTPQELVPVGPASDGRGTPLRLRALQPAGGGYVTQELSTERVFVRHESPRHYPRNMSVERRRVLAWLPPVDGLALQVLALEESAPADAGRAPSPVPARGTESITVPKPLIATRGALDNGICRASIDASGALAFTAPDGRTLHDVLGLEVVGDRGDLYTHSPMPGTHAVGRITSHRVIRGGSLRHTLRLTMRARLPERLVFSAAGQQRTVRASSVEVRVDVTLDAGASRLDFRVHGDHRADDCRVRLLVRSGISTPHVIADAAFGDVERGRVVDDDVPPMGRAREVELRTAPLHRYVTLGDSSRGVSILGDGLAEYEVMADGTVAVTLVRAVGDLSIGNIPERPGFAGWPVPTPGAQSHGFFEARFALMAHGAPNDDVRTAVRAAAEDFLLPLTGATWISAIDPPDHVDGLRLTGSALAFDACKESEDGTSLVVRCTNRSASVASGAWRLAGVREAWLARLDETPLGVLPVRDGTVEFTAPPYATVTILLRP